MLPEGFLEGVLGDAYLDWSEDYPGSQVPPPPPQPPVGDEPLLNDAPPPNTNMDAWALGMIAQAWHLTTGQVIDPRTAMVLAALSRTETFYGWPLFPTGVVDGRDARGWWGHHNWGATTCYTVLGGRPMACYQNGGCVTGFLDAAKVLTSEGWKLVAVCYEHHDTNLKGAIGYIRTILAVGSDQAEVRAVLASGSAYDVAMMLRATGVLLRTDNADPKQMQQDAAYYASRIMRGARTIAINTGAPMVLDGTLPEGVTVPPTVGSEPPGLTDYPPAEAASIGAAGAIAGVALGAVIGVAGAWAYRKARE